MSGKIINLLFRKIIIGMLISQATTNLSIKREKYMIASNHVNLSISLSLSLDTHTKKKRLFKLIKKYIIDKNNHHQLNDCFYKNLCFMI